MTTGSTAALPESSSDPIVPASKVVPKNRGGCRWQKGLGVEVVGTGW